MTFLAVNQTANIPMGNYTFFSLKNSFKSASSFIIPFQKIWQLFLKKISKQFVVTVPYSIIPLEGIVFRKNLNKQNEYKTPHKNMYVNQVLCHLMLEEK